MQQPDTLTGALCRYLNEERIDYCVLGYGASDEIQIVVPTAVRARMAAVLRAFCASHDVELMHYRRGIDRVETYGIGGFDPELPLRFTAVEVRSDYLRCGRMVFSAEQLLRDRVPASEASGSANGCFIAAPAREFICHLLRCIDRGRFGDRDGMHLSEQWRLDAGGVAMQLDRFWNAEREGGVILRAAASGNWEPVAASMRALQTTLSLRNVLTPFAWLRSKLIDIESWFQPSGLLLACLGPEGSGKRSVIAALSERKSEPFRHVHTMVLRPGLMRPSSLEPNPSPQRRPVRGRIATVAKMMMFVADYWLGYWLLVRPKLVRSTLVVSDRYFDDVLVDPGRYRMRRPRAFVRMLLRWIPRPELWLLFDIKSETLQARQPALPEEEARRQRAEYRRVLRGHENVVVLDADQALDRLVAQAERAIVSQLARRTALRLGLPLDTTTNPPATRLLLFFSRRNVPLLSHMVRALFNSDIRCRLPTDVQIPNPYGIVIHPQAVIGRRVTVMHQVTIGSKDAGESIAPVIGDDVYIGTGARVRGDVRIGQGATIGANAVVTRDIPPGVTVVGVNRIVTGTRSAHAGTLGSDRSVARFPIGAHRGSRAWR